MGREGLVFAPASFCWLAKADCSNAALRIKCRSHPIAVASAGKKCSSGLGSSASVSTSADKRLSFAGRRFNWTIRVYSDLDRNVGLRRSVSLPQGLEPKWHTHTHSLSSYIYNYTYTYRDTYPCMYTYLPPQSLVGINIRYSDRAPLVVNADGPLKRDP